MTTTTAKKLRYIDYAHRAPATGTPFRLYGKPVVSEGAGKSWCADEDTSSIGGPVGCEGERVCYVYYRPATEAEVAALDASDAAQKARAEKVRAQRAAITEVMASDDCPNIGKIPDGAVIWENSKSALHGYSEQIILSNDGYLWSVVYDGSDGAAWGDYNLGYNTRGSRLLATPELIAAIKCH